ncbi:MAG TPA: hypothetical protein VGJ70_25805 [Solirubrobacteraceae bacterium]
MKTTRIIASAAVAALASAGVATAAEAPTVSAQKTMAGKTAPLTIPGTGVKKGARLPAGARIVYRDVTLTKGQKPTLTLRAPAGKRLRGLAPTEGGVGFVVVRPASYTGKRAVTVRAYAAPKATGEVTGRIYALAR